MKKLLLSLAFMMLSVVAVFADSPLTSTDFYKAYLDIPVVKQASQSNGVMTPQLMNYIANDANPIDIRMAVINALGFGHQENVEKFATFLTKRYNCTMDELDDNLSPKANFCSAYLFAMALYDQDDFLNQMYEDLGESEVDSRTCSIIRSLIYAQTHMNSEGADFVREACGGRYSGKDDIREKAIDIIWGYMRLYEE